jgi:CheY-like chemotaxis protein
MSLTEPSSIGLRFAILGISAALFVLDMLTPLGYTDWVLYVIPVALCMFQQDARAPYVVAFVETMLLIAGYFFSAPGLDQIMAVFNRSIATITLFLVAYLTHRVIIERLIARRLLWWQSGKAEIGKSAAGELSVEAVADQILHAVVRYANAQVGRLYRLENGKLVASASFALDRPFQACPPVPLGETLAGMVAKDGQTVALHDVPPDYLEVSSMTGHAAPRHVLIAAVTAYGQTEGVIELGFMRRGGDFSREITLLEENADAIGIALRSARYRENLHVLLAETQQQSEELQTQHEELRVTNEELEEQGKALRESHARLESHQTELEQTNVQLEEQAQQLVAQKTNLLAAQRTLQRNADELARSNQYKSEFLANMSHELRTPLNSSLILSKLLADNKTGNLSQEQVRYARTIHASNNALLALINDILDLSKIEAGHMDILPESVEVATVNEAMRQLFMPLAQEKGIGFEISVSPDTPQALVTDSQRLQQILKNLLSNALKFTDKGKIALRISMVSGNRIAFAVCDTGIGIPEQQQNVIFEAFRQADGTTSRMYGGTGLGLSISRELARLLGGAISVRSTPDAGSTFTLEVPCDPKAADRGGAARARTTQPGAFDLIVDAPPLPAPAMPAAPAPAGAPTSRSIADDRHQRTRDRIILVIEDDCQLASILYGLAHECGFDCMHAGSAGEALRLAHEFRPHGILLDIGLPDASGLSVLGQLKSDPATRHIPIHMLSGEDHARAALEMGAVGYALKPVAQDDLLAAIGKLEEKSHARLRRILLVEDNAAQRESLALMLKADDIEITMAGTVAEALQHVSETTFDCIVTDLMLPDASGHELLQKMAEGGKFSFPPVIVYTGRSLSRDEEQRLRRYSHSIIIKGAKSPERLLDEVTLFLHRVETALPPAQQQLLRQARQRDTSFENRRILLVEDDVRNVYALSSVLEPLGVHLYIARNGKEALDCLPKHEDIDLVLMDLMMPEMDGLTATREIRKQPKWRKLPIIALTAKAMADDRRNCLDAGANDYIAKPIDVDKLIALCRIWMPK